MMAEFMDFSDLYSVGGQSFVTLQKSAGNFENPENINNFSRKIGVRQGTPQFVFIKQSAPNAYLVPRATTAEVMEDLLGSAIDGAYLDASEARYYAKSNPDLVVLFESDFGAFTSSLAVIKDNDALRSAVNEALTAAKEDGSLDQFITEAYALTPKAPEASAQQ